MLYSVAYWLTAITGLLSPLINASILRRSDEVLTDTNITSTNPLSQTNLSAPLDPRLRIVQLTGSNPIKEIDAYMVFIWGLAQLAQERYTGTAEADRAWGYDQYPDVFVHQVFKKPVQRKILVLSFIKIILGFAEQKKFLDSDNTVYWTERDLGVIQVRKREKPSMLDGPGAATGGGGNDNTTALLSTGLSDSNAGAQLVIDRSRAALAKDAVYITLSLAIWAVAQSRVEQEYEPFAVAPDNYDVGLTFEEPLGPHTRKLTWGNINDVMVQLSDSISRGLVGGKFAELYGKITLEGEICAQWKLQRGRPEMSSQNGGGGKEVRLDGVGSVMYSGGSNGTAGGHSQEDVAFSRSGAVEPP